MLELPPQFSSPFEKGDSGHLRTRKGGDSWLNLASLWIYALEPFALLLLWVSCSIGRISVGFFFHLSERLGAHQSAYHAGPDTGALALQSKGRNPCAHRICWQLGLHIKKKQLWEEMWRGERLRGQRNKEGRVIAAIPTLSWLDVRRMFTLLLSVGGWGGTVHLWQTDKEKIHSLKISAKNEA